MASPSEAVTCKASNGSSAKGMEMNFEAVVIPVTNVERAKDFYTKLGWHLDADFSFDNDFHLVQFTPPGSGCSVQFGTRMTSAAPGSAQGLYLSVPDIEPVREAIAACGIDVSEVFHVAAPGAQFQFGEKAGRISGPAPNHPSYRSFATFSDPDGNGWLIQEVTTRLRGEMSAGTAIFPSPSHLASALRRAAAAHDQHEARSGQRDENWADWYAKFMASEQAGVELPT